MADTTKLTIELITILRGLDKTVRGLDTVEKKLRSVAAVKIGGATTAQTNKAVLAAQKLQQQQQKLSVQAQELANRQERARQATDRLAQSQQRAQLAAERLAKAQERINRASAASKLGRDADAHVREFRAAQREVERQQRAQTRAAESLQRQRSAALLREERERQRSVLSLQKQRSAALFKQFQEQERLQERARKSAFSLDQALGRIGGTLSRVGGGLRSFGAALAAGLTAPLVAFGIIAARSAQNIDAIRNRLIATEGSIEAANQRLTRLRQLADTSVGVTRAAANEAFATLSVVGGITEETIERQIKALGRLNAAFTIDDQPQFFRNLIQIFSQGFERADIKEAIGRVPIFNQLLDEAFGTADAGKLRELKAAGKLTLDTFLAGLAGAVEGSPVLGQIRESIGVRLTKTFERLTDALAPIGDAILGPIERIVVAVEPFILKLADGFKSLSPEIQNAVVIAAGLVGVVGPLLILLGGLVTAIGGLITVGSAIAGVVGAIGLPALAAILAGLVIILGEITTAAVLLFKAWQTNFLGIRGIVADAATAVLEAFNRIRGVINEAVQRILPTLQSITTKILNVVTAAWNRYGKDIVAFVGTAFRFVTRVIETFTRTFGDFVDLLLKLIDSDFQGAWRAFARIVVKAAEDFRDFLQTLGQIAIDGFLEIVKFIEDQATKLVDAAKGLGKKFVNALAGELVSGAPQIRNAIQTMLLLAVAAVNPVNLGRGLAAGIIEGLKQAAREGLSGATEPEEERGFELFTETRKKARGASAEGGEAKGLSRLRSAQNDLRDAENEFTKAQAENRLAETRAAIEQQAELTREGLDRELSLLKDQFEDRLVAVQKYFKERQRLEEAAIDAEITKEKGLSSALSQEWENRRNDIERVFETSLAEINRDPQLKGQARSLAIQTAEKKKQTDLSKAESDFLTNNVQVSTRILILERQRKQVAEDLGKEHRVVTEELRRQQDQIQAELFEAQGFTFDAAAVRLRANFKDTLKDLRIDVAALAPELQSALNAVDLKTLKSRLDELPEPVRLLIQLLEISAARAAIVERTIDVDRTLAELRIRETDIQNKVLDGVLSERDARAEILGLQQISRARLLDILAAQLAIARAAGQQDEILRIQAQIQEVKRLGEEIDLVGQRINRDLFGDLESGLTNIFSSARRGIDGFKDALISLGDSLLNTLNRLASESIMQKLFGDLLKPDAESKTGTASTIGSKIARLFGLGPKPAQLPAAGAAAGGIGAAATGVIDASALTAGAAVAGTTLVTASVTASTTWLTGVVASASSFAASVIAAGAGFAASVAAAAGAQSVGGLGSVLGSGAATGMFPAVPGGMVKIVEGGYPEAVLTTDPKYAARQFQILREYLAHTKGLFGRVKEFASGGWVPSLAEGAFMSTSEAEGRLAASIAANRLPSFIPHVPEAALAGGSRGRNIRFVFLDDGRDVKNWINSAEGEQVIVEKLVRNTLIKRSLGGRDGGRN